METIKATLYWIASIETGRAAAGTWSAATVAAEEYGSAPLHALLWFVLTLLCIALAIASLLDLITISVAARREKRKSV